MDGHRQAYLLVTSYLLLVLPLCQLGLLHIPTRHPSDPLAPTTTRFIQVAEKQKRQLCLAGQVQQVAIPAHRFQSEAASMSMSIIYRVYKVYLYVS